MKWLTVTSLKQKINMYMFVGIFIPFILLVFIHSWINTNQVEKILTDNTEQMLAQVDMMLGLYTQTIENTIGIIEESPYVSEFTGEAMPDTKGNLRSFFTGIEQLYPEIAAVLIVNENGDYVSNEIYRTARDPLTNEYWYTRAMQNPDETVFISRPAGRNLTPRSNYGADEIMSFVKAIKSPGTDKPAGVLLLDLRLSAFDEKIKDITVGSQGFLYITNAAGSEIIYAPYNNVVYRIDNRFVLDNENEKTVIRINDDKYQVVCRRAENWNVIGVFPISDIMSAINLPRNFTIGLFIAILILVQIFSRQLEKMLVIPLKRLQTLMKQTENGRIDVRFEVESNDEIGALGNSFNRMIVEIKKLLQIIDDENKLKREAEFRALQEQIKPHFLYNTLDTINWIAVENDVPEIAKIVAALTNLFRLSLNNGREFVVISDEIKQVKNYLTIQNIRYEESFKSTFDIPAEIADYYVIKLILQPLVENSIYHGIKEKASLDLNFKGMIHISAKKDGDLIILSVSDNGSGVTPKKAEKINEMFESGSKELGYGLYNVNQRLKYSFGAKYGLRLESVLGEGTTVTVYHPATPRPLMEGENYEAVDS